MFQLYHLHIQKLTCNVVTAHVYTQCGRTQPTDTLISPEQCVCVCVATLAELNRHVLRALFCISFLLSFSHSRPDVY